MLEQYPSPEEAPMRDLSTKEGMVAFLKVTAERAIDFRKGGFSNKLSLSQALNEQPEYANLSPQEKDKVESMSIQAISEIELHRIRLAQKEKEPAKTIIAGRIPHRNERQNYSGRDLAAGAEAEDRRDEVAAQIPPLRAS